MRLADCLHDFFRRYLPDIKGAGRNTIDSYRRTFSLFLKFAAARRKTAPGKLQISHMTSDLIFAFLNHLEKDRGNSARTRNCRLAAIKSFARMLRLLHPGHAQTAGRILNIPQKRCQKRLIGFLTHDEVIRVFESVDLKRKEGFRDYAILHLLYDSGIRAAELAALKPDDFDPGNRTLAVTGKGERFRLVRLRPKTAELLESYIEKHRPEPRIPHEKSLFVNQRKEALTRHGVSRICGKHLKKCFSGKRLASISPAHSFRHSCAVAMLLAGEPLTNIKNHLGHEKLSSTMIYLHMDLSRKREVQKRFIDYSLARLGDDPKVKELIGWEDRDEILNWLDSL